MSEYIEKASQTKLYEVYVGNFGGRICFQNILLSDSERV